MQTGGQTGDGESCVCVLPPRELKHGIPVTDENGNRLGESASAAQQAISQVVISRILMASPGMGQSRFIPFTEVLFRAPVRHNSKAFALSPRDYSGLL